MKFSLPLFHSYLPNVPDISLVSRIGFASDQFKNLELVSNSPSDIHKMPDATNINRRCDKFREEVVA